MSNEKIGIIDKIKRLNRIAGQVEGIKKMVEDERFDTAARRPRRRQRNGNSVADGSAAGQGVADDWRFRAKTRRTDRGNGYADASLRGVSEFHKLNVA